MASATIDISNGDGPDLITIQPARHALRLVPAVGGVQMELSLSVGRNGEPKDPRPLLIAATMRVSRTPNHDSRALCKVEAEHLITPVQQAGEHTLTGFISDAQLRAVEQMRAAGALRITLALTLTWVSSATPVPSTQQSSGNLTFDVPSGEWIEELERVDAATHVELLIPISDNAKHAKAAHRIRTARDHLRAGETGAAVGEIRKPLDRIRKENRTGPTAGPPSQRPTRTRPGRTLGEIFTEALFDLLSGEAHDDPGTTEHFTWTRADAAVLTATVAGLLARQTEAQPPAR